MNFFNASRAVVAALLSVALLCTVGVAQARGTHRDQAAAPKVQPHTLYSGEQLSNGFAACASQFPRGVPLDISRLAPALKARALCSNHFAVLYSGQSKTPLLVVERLNRAQLKDALDEERTDLFFADPRLPKHERAELRDFYGSGCDRGHMAPAADQPDATSMAQSFALANMVCQDPKNNRKVWKKLEGDTRKYAMRAEGDVFVFSGPLFQGTSTKTIGRGQVWVPSHLFKLVYDERAHRAWAQVLPNTADAQLRAPMSYDDFVRQTQWRVLDGLTLQRDAH